MGVLSLGNHKKLQRVTIKHEATILNVIIQDKWDKGNNLHFFVISESVYRDIIKQCRSWQEFVK